MTLRASLSRRAMLMGTAAVLTPLACRASHGDSSRATQKEDKNMTHLMPTLYVPHGGGPWPWVDMGAMSAGMEPLREYLTHLPQGLPERPKALLVISAHWEEEVPTVQAGAKPPMLYDYSGFPRAAYEVKWPAPGSPETAARVRAVLAANDIDSASSAERGFDHGAFVVTALMYPGADIPTFQLSLTRDLKPRRLFSIGRALAPLRREGILILGSGFSYHNMQGFFRAMRGDPSPREDSKFFDDWLYETLDRPPSERESRLIEWEKAPRARACHPREEHLLPLLVAAGAAAEGRVEIPYRTPILGTHTLAAHFT